MSLEERDQAMARLFRAGMTLQEIGTKYGVTRERVRQRLAKIGVKRVDGGGHLRATLRAAARHNELDEKCFSKFGCGWEQYRTLRDIGVTRLYKRQRASAFDRGIEWHFTLATWWAVWSASGKWAMRGRGKGKYCMARFGDSGPYSPDNVEIILTEENCAARPKERFKRGGVYLLYPGLSKSWVARYGNKVVGRFHTEQEARAAREKFLASMETS